MRRSLRGLGVLRTLLLVLLSRTATAQGPPAVDWSVLASGGAANGGAIAIADSVGEPVLGASSSGTTLLAGGYFPGALRDGDETWCALPVGLPAASHDFNLTARVSIAVSASGTLGCLRVKRTDALPPNSQAGIQNDRWWELTGTDAGGGPAAGFTLTMTLPLSGTLADPRVCRWTGSAWDCVVTSSTTTTVTRAGITALSEWAVGEGPVPVTLSKFDVD